MVEPGPVPPVERMRQEVDRWLDAVRTTGEKAMESLGIGPAARPCNCPVDVIELAEEVIVQLDLPGISAEMVELNLAGNLLSVSANRPTIELPPGAKVHQRERIGGTFSRSVAIPATVDENAIRAELRDGLLTITLRKITPSPGRSIPITTSV